MSDFIIAYDITSPRRLQKMHRFLQKSAVPIQYSVFYLSLDERQLPKLLDEAESLIDKCSDDLRCYPLPARGLKTRLGRSTFPTGIQYTGLPAQWMEER